MGKSLETEENSVQTTRLKRILLSASLAIPVILSATVGYFAVRISPNIVQFSLLAFIACILFIASIEEMIPEANRNYDAPLAGIFLVLPCLPLFQSILNNTCPTGRCIK
ncbi:hypothetical protein [Pontibacter ummariensis]|uniref:hypothetical protein n=1 Tax=Pontibacter ummariensis TaxID=1610492 RepID=UPI001185B885|nr:hypothetical protein [Pontibacter ummariensis]